jgi:diadenosine tetraphosphate (Ap4A) HIT family hydrolase
MCALAVTSVTSVTSDPTDGESITIHPNQSGKLWSEDPAGWRALCTEDGCPWCQGPGPPAEDVIAETEMCWVTAPVDATLPGYACVSTKAHIVEPYDLSERDRDQFFGDAMAVARGLANAVRPAKMNYEIHGNTVPHLHMHLFPRFPDDPYVGYVITSRTRFTRTPGELEILTSAVRAELAATGRLI